MAARPHVVVVHRWRARYAEYAGYIDHRTHAVTYVSTEVGAAAVPQDAAAVLLVDATDDLPAVRDRVKQLAHEFGPPTAIIALKEDDLLVAAQLRQEWGCAGWTPAQVRPYRDKATMLGQVAGAGLAVPAYTTVREPAAVRAFGDRYGWPVIVKPRTGSSSAGVVRLDGPRELGRLDLTGRPRLLAQAFDPRPIHHVDGYFDGAALGPYRVSRYLNTCLDFRAGVPLGSVEDDDPGLIRAVGRYATRALAALSDRPTVFHLELFVDRATGDCAFLEAGARVGGAEIPFLWREVHGYDLMEAAFRLGLGQPPPPWPGSLAEPGGEVTGWLLAPAPARRPCRIAEAGSMLQRRPGPYAEAVLAPGEVLPAADAYYEHVGGRFRFRGRTSAEVAAAVTATARDFRVSAVPL
ncbi:acetyl-CoA carboxylase biotin carboxylase subunit family protein [Actinoplanes sp. NPDC049681]|uniref:acetyl-CoA carboxylase biotin carboxylase subunit family protein n=1 Tax=Actinoplanes sp. NPDC049681 TaxID=3363905 RepID=UPI0037AE3F1F